MTIEEIKEWWDGEAYTAKFAVGDVTSAEIMNFLISRVEELEREVEELHKDGMTIYAMMGADNTKKVARRCAEIAEEVETGTYVTFNSVVADAIRREFGGE